MHHLYTLSGLTPVIFLTLCISMRHYCIYMQRDEVFYMARIFIGRAYSRDSPHHNLYIYAPGDWGTEIAEPLATTATERIPLSYFLLLFSSLSFIVWGSWLDMRSVAMNV